MTEGTQLPERSRTHLRTAEPPRISPATLHETNYKKTGPRSFRVGRYRRYNRSDVLEWRESRAPIANACRAGGGAP